MKKVKEWLSVGDLQTFAAADGGEDDTSSEGTQATGQAGNDPEGQTPEGTPGEGEPNEGKALTSEDIQKMIQSETDKVRTEYSNKMKKLESEKEAAIKDKMTEAEKRDYEINKREREIREKEDMLSRQTVEITATNLLSEKDLPLTWRPFVMKETPEETQEAIEKFSALWKQEIDAQVTKRLAGNGGTPGRSATHGRTPGTSMNDLIRGAARR